MFTFSKRNSPVSILIVDIDAYAEKIVVLDRKNLNELFKSKTYVSGKNIILPESCATTDQMIVIIVDADLVYAAKSLDGVLANLP